MDSEAIEAKAEADRAEVARKYYNALFDMYETPGWKQVMEEIGEQARLLQDVRRMTPATLETAQGALKVLDAMLSHETMSRNAYDMIFAQPTETVH